MDWTLEVVILPVSDIDRAIGPLIPVDHRGRFGEGKTP